jgi:hypothetical protein
MKPLKFIKTHYYIIFQLLIFAILFYIGIGNFFAFDITHEYPFNYFAGDAFGHLSAAEALQDQGHYLYLPPHLNKGVEKTLPHYTPGMVHWSVLTGSLTKTNLHNSLNLLTGILFILLPFIFINALNLSKPTKLIALSFTPLLFQNNWMIVYSWGQVGAIMGTFFLYAFYLIFTRKETNKNPYLLGLLLAATFLIHFPEALFIVFFITIFIIIDFIKNKNLKKYKWLPKMIIIFLLLSSFYLVIFYFGNVQTYEQQDSMFKITQHSPEGFDKGMPTVKFTDYHLIFKIIFIIGLILTLFINTFETNLILIYTLTLGFLNYFSFFTFAYYRAFQQRGFWAFTLMPFIAIPIIAKLKERTKNIKNKKIIQIGIATLIFISLFTFTLVQFEKTTGPGIITEQQYEAIQFLNENTNEDDKILFLYGDGYDQSTLLLKRVHYLTPLSFIIEVLEEKTTINTPTSFKVPEKGTLNTFKNKKITKAIFPEESTLTICDFDYYILDVFSRYGNKDPIGFNRHFTEITYQPSFKVVYDNKQTLVVQKVGEQCLKEK